MNNTKLIRISGRGITAKLLTHEQYIWLLQGLSVEQPKAIKTAPKRDVI